MVKIKQQYICNNCANITTKWAGKCENCGTWNSIEEYHSPNLGFVTSKHTANKLDKLSEISVNKITFADMASKSAILPRFTTHINEFDRVCGGNGIVQGSTILLGGDPGIGKSTLLMQVISLLSKERSCVYISGEESVDQIKRRSNRLSINSNNLKIANAINLLDILHTLNDMDNLEVLIIDSIQTMYLESINSIAGSINQVKACANELINYCKQKNIVLIMIGHVTKEGIIAGPRILEHMVDCVLHFEGEKNNNFRILRAIKNRFGPTDELGIFEMTQEGLISIDNPSQLFLQEYSNDVSGSSIYPGLEGLRPILVEVQALLVNSFYPTPKRSCVGVDYNRLSMLTAVLEAKAGIVLSNKDIYLNIVGGLKITDPALDLAIIASLISAFMNKNISNNTVFIGEVSLSGHIRSVNNLSKRLQESSRIGFNSAVIPKISKKILDQLKIEFHSLNLIQITTVSDIVKLLKQ